MLTACVTFLPCYSYQGFFFFFFPQIVIVLTVSEPLQVLTMDQRFPGSYKNLFFLSAVLWPAHFLWLRNDSFSALLFCHLPFTSPC